eukprot:CAMPEP_0198126118 /NCGR_PEP_ID=MMETSP1442-20131203/44095_1 /TAXON_ID= /ORGANISM="Craspedostauros australis, Strain CCMP3328" /LENGTH=49 /DNA_ID=CAMNT_0043785847 /DNA_START=223 /DNA_END=372 /DNA_ORIENTATION=+
MTRAAAMAQSEKQFRQGSTTKIGKITPAECLWRSDRLLSDPQLMALLAK